MSVFLLILIGIFAVDLVWAVVAVRIARRVRWRGFWIGLNLAFVAVQFAGLLVFILGRFLGHDWDRKMPRIWISSVLLWHLLGLGVMICAGAIGMVWILARWVRRRPNGRLGEASLPSGSVSRREFLGMAALASPPLFTIFLSTITQAQLRHFRVRRFEIPLQGLPAALDGVTLAHVSDMHLGRLTSDRVLREMVKTVNDLKTDLILMTGDLINDELADLPEGLRLASAMHGRFGHCLIEGNHDLIESREIFESRARASPVPFLVDQSLHLDVRGHPVQLLGLRWDNSRTEGRDAAIDRSMGSLLAQREKEAFPIVLAHHPHAFDPAAAAGIPLTLAGHTHGGQLMLTDDIGFGPMLYRYWSGLYRKGSSRLVVSNGVGNWFPLRTNAPAEIVHVTLRRV